MSQFSRIKAISKPQNPDANFQADNVWSKPVHEIISFVESDTLPVASPKVKEVQKESNHSLASLKEQMRHQKNQIKQLRAKVEAEFRDMSDVKITSVWASEAVEELEQEQVIPPWPSETPDEPVKPFISEPVVVEEQEKKKKRKKHKKKSKELDDGNLITIGAVTQIVEDEIEEPSEEDKAREDRFVDDFRKRLETISDNEIQVSDISTPRSSMTDSSLMSRRRLKPNLNTLWLEKLASRLSKRTGKSEQEVSDLLKEFEH